MISLGESQDFFKKQMTNDKNDLSDSTREKVY